MYDAGLWIWPIVAAPIVGSFLGVLVLRLPAGRPFALARSACPHCGTTLGAADLVPLASWVVLRGRCRHCSAALGAFYPGIEIAAVGIAAWATLALPGSLVWIGCILGWMLLAAALIDFRHLILPDALVLPLIPAGIVLHDHKTAAKTGRPRIIPIGSKLQAIIDDEAKNPGVPLQRVKRRDGSTRTNDTEGSRGLCDRHCVQS